MTILEKINTDFITAFKNKDINQKNFLGFLKSEIQNEKGRGTTINDNNIRTILRKIEKNLYLCNQHDQINYLRKYLPELMSEDKIKEIILNYKNNGITNVGKIMAQFTKEYTGLADNKTVSDIAKKIV